MTRTKKTFKGLLALLVSLSMIVALGVCVLAAMASGETRAILARLDLPVLRVLLDHLAPKAALPGLLDHPASPVPASSSRATGTRAPPTRLAAWWLPATACSPPHRP